MPSPTARDALFAIGIGFLVILAANALVAMALGLLSGGVQVSPEAIAGPGLVLQGVCMVAFVVHVAWRTDDGALKALATRPGRRWWLVPLILPAGLLSDLTVQELQAIAPALDLGGIEALNTALEQQKAWIIVGAVGLAPVYEELLFRGLAWTGFERSLGRWRALLITTGIFAAFHADPLHIAGVFVVGLWLGWIRMASGSVLPCIAAHLINNLLWAVLGGVLPVEHMSPWWALPCLAILGLGAALSVRPLPTPPSGLDSPGAPGP